jgi:superfamily II DNA helicase RecQ
MAFNYKTIKEYLEFKECKQKYILKYFDEKLSKNCGICDFCLKAGNKKFTPSDLDSFTEYLNNLPDSWHEIEDLICYDTYLNRQKNKMMLKKFIKADHFEISGNRIRKIRNC